MLKKVLQNDIKRLIIITILISFSTNNVFAFAFSSYAKKYTLGGVEYACFDIRGVKFLAHQEVNLDTCREKYQLYTKKYNLCTKMLSDYKKLLGATNLKLKLLDTKYIKLQNDYTRLVKTHNHTVFIANIYRYTAIASLVAVLTTVLILWVNK